MADTETNLVYGKSTHVELISNMDVGIGGDKWPAATKFCELVCHEKFHDFFSKLFNNKRIIDFGSGTGLTGIVIDKVFTPSEIIVTDQESHMELIRHNLQINNATMKCKEQTYDWNECEAMNVGKSDIILALECVYREDLYRPLIASMVACSHENSYAFLGITREFIKPLFFELLSQHVTYTLIAPELLLFESSASSSAIQQLQQGGDNVYLYVNLFRSSMSTVIRLELTINVRSLFFILLIDQS